MHDVQPLAIPNINQQGETMHIYADVKIGKVSDHLYTLLTLTKAKKFRVGFILYWFSPLWRFPAKLSGS